MPITTPAGFNHVSKACTAILRGSVTAEEVIASFHQQGLSLNDKQTEVIYESETIYQDYRRQWHVDDTVMVKGTDGRPDYTANYRGHSGGMATIIPAGGMQISVPESLIISKVTN